jgi:hypothetical protein
LISSAGPAENRSVKKQLLFALILTVVFHGILVFTAEALARDAGRGRPLAAEGPLRAEVRYLLSDVEALHVHLVERKDPAVAASLNHVKRSLSRVRTRSALAGPQRQHVEKILLAAERGVDLAKTKSGVAKREGLQEAYFQLVQLVRMFDFREYRIFFCPRDKSTWFQRGAKPRNPISPERFLNCGKVGS